MLYPIHRAVAAAAAAEGIHNPKAESRNEFRKKFNLRDVQCARVLVTCPFVLLHTLEVCVCNEV